jgi:hypothetical protein
LYLQTRRGFFAVHRDVTLPFYVGGMSLPQYTPPVVVCTMCDDNLLHCHGTAIVMSDSSHVCSDDPDCTLSVNEHWFMSIEDDEASLQ